MHQPQLNGKKTWFVILLAFLALSSFGFALLGLVVGPELTFQLEQQRQVGPEQLARPEIPNLEPMAEFWHNLGYYPIKQEQSYEIQRDAEFWMQGTETWVLVPGRHGLELTPQILTLCGSFLDEGWLIQIESTKEGYILGFWSKLPLTGERVLAYLWELKVLTPQNYNNFHADLIPVMGEFFDPEAFLRGTPEAPLLAIIIDDWGYLVSSIDSMLGYPFPLTVAILPHLMVSKEVSERAYSAGHEVILHQPMEALNSGLDLGPGGITVGMDPEDLAARFRENVASLPTIVGVNNHMGSKATEDPETMAQVLELAKELGLFFVDSRTSNFSVVAEVAKAVGVPYGVNNLFIDNESDVEKIKGQIRSGLALAQKQGHAVMIGHVRPATDLALWEMIPEILASNVRLVPISALLQNPEE